MAITIHSRAEIESMRNAGKVAAATLAHVCSKVRAGISTAQIDAWVREDTSARGATPSQLGYHGFPANVCTSRNEVVCHGIPSAKEMLSAGDIVNIDVTSCFEGFHGDTSVTLMVGEVSPEVQGLVAATQASLQRGIEQVRPSARLGDVGAAIDAFAREAGFGVVTQFGGHGIGRKMHMAPHVSHRGMPGRGPRLRPGMTFTIEPMLTFGEPKLRIEADGWRVVTEDGSYTAQFEHTILVTEHGAEVLTEVEAGVALAV